MTTRTITYIFSLLFAICSCTDEVHENGTVCHDANTLWVDFEGTGTKVYVDGVRTLLHDEDLFTVFHQSSVNEQWVYVGKDGTADGMLSLNGKIERVQEFQKIYAVYPWEETASVSNGVITTSLPDTQFFTKKTFGRRAAVLAAETENNTLHFNYASGFVCLTLNGNAQIKEIVLRTRGGEKIAGACTVDMNSGIPVMSAYGTSSVLLRNLDSTPINVEESEDFIFSAAPGTYDDGIEFSITYTTGQKQVVKVTGPFTIKAGNISAPVVSDCQHLFCLEANFYTDGQSSVNPFSVSVNRDIVPGTTGSTSESADIFLRTDTDRKYPFRFYIADKDGSDNLRITRSGLNFGGSVGDYIKFPGIDGMILTSVHLTTSKSCSVKIGALEAVTVPSNVPVVMTILESRAGEPVKMELREAQTLRLHNITLCYDLAL